MKKQTNRHQHPSSMHATHQAKVAAASPPPEKDSLRIYTRMLHVDSTQHHTYLIFSKGISEGVLMIQDKREKELVSKINFGGQTKKEKYTKMAAYHFKFVFNMYTTACNNVSENPGFETCVIIWG
eukprot:4585032-Ditylum_brightwellii.AAC.1